MKKKTLARIFFLHPGKRNFSAICLAMSHLRSFASVTFGFDEKKTQNPFLNKVFKGLLRRTTLDVVVQAAKSQLLKVTCYSLRVFKRK